MCKLQQFMIERIYREKVSLQILAKHQCTGKCKSWTLDSGLDSWTGLWTDIWTGFRPEKVLNDDLFQLCSEKKAMTKDMK